MLAAAGGDFHLRGAVVDPHAVLATAGTRRGVLHARGGTRICRRSAAINSPLNGALAIPLVVLTAMLLAAPPLLLYHNLPQELVPSEIARCSLFHQSTEGRDAGLRRGYADRADLAAFVRARRAWRLVSIVGRGDSNQAFVVVGLSDWSQRARGQQAIVNALRGVYVIFLTYGLFRSVVSSLGAAPAASRAVGDRWTDYPTVVAWSEAIMARARDNPGLTSIDSDYQASQPTLRVEIDRALADELGIPGRAHCRHLADLAGFARDHHLHRPGSRVSTVCCCKRKPSTGASRVTAGIFVRADKSGELAPLGAVVDLREDDSALTLRA